MFEMPDAGRTVTPGTARSGPTRPGLPAFARSAARRVLMPVWRTLVVYGAIWLPSHYHPYLGEYAPCFPAVPGEGPLSAEDEERLRALDRATWPPGEPGSEQNPLRLP
ncbi:hypothetical protein ABZ023_31405 [Streptomyces sp. NPDC006367]|uniref:hypothetical protein n=1 Tax=unclassified Streptomyces TaxID=2593676 RepID=UPI0033BC5B86